MLLCEGTVVGVTERSGDKNGKPWTMRTLRLFGGKTIHYVNLADGFDESSLPAEGEPVTVEVSQDAYINGQGRARAGLTGWRVHVETEQGRRIAAAS